MFGVVAGGRSGADMSPQKHPIKASPVPRISARSRVNIEVRIGGEIEKEGIGIGLISGAQGLVGALDFGSQALAKQIAMLTRCVSELMWGDVGFANVVPVEGEVGFGGLFKKRKLLACGVVPKASAEAQKQINAFHFVGR